jgi:hypothetical protein
VTEHVAKSLDALFGQLNTIAPRRNRRSDGAKGNEEHARRESDHNPDRWGIIRARDFTHDPAGGLDCARLASALREGRDTRVGYVIWRGQIMSGAGGREPWRWRAYAGTNPHNHHLHLSVVADPARADSAALWALPGLGARPVLRRRDSGHAVEELQGLLGLVGAGEPGFGLFGPKTEAAVVAFQRAHGLTPDGIVGPATWAAIERVAAA